MKKVLAILVLAALLVGGKVAWNIWDNTKQERYLLGEWKGVVVFDLEKREFVTDGSLKMNIDKDKAVYDYGPGITEYNWECTNYFSDMGAFGYEFIADNTAGNVYAAGDEAFILCQWYGENQEYVRTTVFVKEDNYAEIDKYTDYYRLLNVKKDRDLAELGISCIEDDVALDYINGSWYGSRYVENGETSYVPGGVLDFEVISDVYYVTMYDEYSSGNVEFTGFVNNIYAYSMDGEYEDIDLAYDEASNTLTMWEEATGIGVIMKKWK